MQRKGSRAATMPPGFSSPKGLGFPALSDCAAAAEPQSRSTAAQRTAAAQQWPPGGAQQAHACTSGDCGFQCRLALRQRQPKSPGFGLSLHWQGPGALLPFMQGWDRS